MSSNTYRLLEALSHHFPYLAFAFGNGTINVYSRLKKSLPLAKIAIRVEAGRCYIDGEICDPTSFTEKLLRRIDEHEDIVYVYADAPEKNAIEIQKIDSIKENMQGLYALMRKV